MWQRHWGRCAWFFFGAGFFWLPLGPKWGDRAWVGKENPDAAAGIRGNGLFLLACHGFLRTPAVGRWDAGCAGREQASPCDGDTAHSAECLCQTLECHALLCRRRSPLRVKGTAAGNAAF